MGENSIMSIVVGSAIVVSAAVFWLGAVLAALRPEDE